MNPKVMLNIDLSKGYLTEQEIHTLKMRLNHNESLNYTPIELSDIPIPDEGLAISDEQTEKGYKWLLNQVYSSTGRIKSDWGQIGNREKEIIDNFEAMGYMGEFRLICFVNKGTKDNRWFVPVYRVLPIIKSTGHFDYLYTNGKMEIVG
jgi:hypothetical protein